MELRWLESFVVVADELHFARAADRLHLAPSALSAQVRALESHLGVRLIDRGRRARPALTSAGRLFLDEARLTLDQAARAEAVGRRAGRGELGHAQFAYVASAAFSGVLTDVLTRCAAHGTELTVQVRELETPAQLEALACGDVDVGFLRSRPEYPPEVTATCLLTEQVVLALPAAAPLAAYEAIPAAKLCDENLHLVGALVREDGLQVVGMAQRRILQGDAVGAQDGAALPRDRDGLPDVFELAHADLLGPDAVQRRADAGLCAENAPSTEAGKGLPALPSPPGPRCTAL
ncbi:DNA-binding transcriptional LysR family regulator [Streptomyces sp. B4I13]|nr:DNA-binding transcriptional LysR family regulator [Streptomyces sp. B4I13]